MKNTNNIKNQQPTMSVLNIPSTKQCTRRHGSNNDGDRRVRRRTSLSQRAVGQVTVPVQVSCR